MVKSSAFLGGLQGGVQEVRENEDLLIVQARLRDRHAFDRLIDRHRTALCTFLRGRVGREALEDIVQETLIGAWEGLPGYRTSVRFRPWLLRIAANKAVDLYRVRVRRSESPLPEIERPSPGAARAFAAVELRDTVRTLMESLGETQREVLELYYYAEMTLPEIARATGRNLNTVKYQFYAAHQRAARLLSDAETVEGEERRPR